MKWRKLETIFKKINHSFNSNKVNQIYTIRLLSWVEKNRQNMILDDIYSSLYYLPQYSEFGYAKKKIYGYSLHYQPHKIADNAIFSVYAPKIQNCLPWPDITWLIKPMARPRNQEGSRFLISVPSIQISPSFTS